MQGKENRRRQAVSPGICSTNLPTDGDRFLVETVSRPHAQGGDNLFRVAQLFRNLVRLDFGDTDFLQREVVEGKRDAVRGNVGLGFRRGHQFPVQQKAFKVAVYVTLRAMVSLVTAPL